MTGPAPDAWVLRLGPVDAPTAWIRISAEQAAAIRTAPFRDNSQSFRQLTRLSPTEMHVRDPSGVDAVLQRVPGASP